ncbi:MAG: metallophosphoesterase [Deltaproteobacteria bacterium]|nr:metallophosphoesterase [Deltaproteobacteria bacterium]
MTPCAGSRLEVLGVPGLVSTSNTQSVNPRRRQLAPPRVVTGKERRWLNPNKGLVKVIERNLDILVSRFVYPHLSKLWNPYSWLLQRRLNLAETTLSPAGWPKEVAPLRVLYISDIHAGIFLRPELLAEIVNSLMKLRPHLAAVGGDLVSGHAREAKQVLDALAPLSAAPLGAWFCFGNHDYFGGDPEEIRRGLLSVNIKTLKNESVKITHGGASFVLGGIDDLIMGKPDWSGVTSKHGAPHLLLAHNPDHFYEAEARGVPLTIAGHTHGGQIRVPNGGPIIRQSRFCLDEGVYAFRSSQLVVSRGLGSIMIPWRWGAEPEAVLIEILSAD